MSALASSTGSLGTFFRRRLRLGVLVIAALGTLALIHTYTGSPDGKLHPRSLFSTTSHQKPFSGLSFLEASSPPAAKRPKNKSKTKSTSSLSDSKRPPSIELTPAEELGAVIAYLTSVGSNAMVPAHVDPLRPIDSELVLEFNTRSARARAELEELVADTWNMHPVVMFTESRAPSSKRAKEIFNHELYLVAEPIIFDVDTRSDVSVLPALMHRLTSSTTLPIVLVGGSPLGTIAQIEALLSGGELEKRLDALGALTRVRTKKTTR